MSAGVALELSYFLASVMSYCMLYIIPVKENYLGIRSVFLLSFTGAFSKAVSSTYRSSIGLAVRREMLPYLCFY